MIPSDIFPDLSGLTVVVVASGSSAPDVLPDLIHYPKICVNLSFRLCPDAFLLYAADCGFWNIYGPEVREKFNGLMVSPAQQAQRIHPSLIVSKMAKNDGAPIHNMISEPLGTVGYGGGNSGFQAVNLVVQMKPARILLAGFDYCGDHFHPDHDQRLRNPSENNLRTWAQFFDNQKQFFDAWGIEVINLSKKSALKNYRYENSASFDTSVTSL